MLLVGVLIALVLRAVFIAAGAAIIASFSWVFYIFGAFLIWTAWKLIQEARADEEEEEFEENRLLKAVEKPLPRRPTATTAPSSSSRENGKRLMTPMLVVMLAIGTTDVLFALDSIPAIFGLTQDPYIVFTANAFALMGLRQLYFLIGGLLKKLVHLSYGLSVILGFIGVKLVLHALHETGVHVPEIGIPFSLGVIVRGPRRHHRHQPDRLPQAGAGGGAAAARVGAGAAEAVARAETPRLRLWRVCDGSSKISAVRWRAGSARTPPAARVGARLDPWRSRSMQAAAYCWNATPNSTLPAARWTVWRPGRFPRVPVNGCSSTRVRPASARPVCSPRSARRRPTGDCLVLAARGGEQERLSAFHVVRTLLQPLLAGLGEEERRELLGGWNDIVGPAVGLAPRTDERPACRPPDPQGVRDGLDWVVTNLAARPRSAGPDRGRRALGRRRFARLAGRLRLAGRGPAAADGGRLSAQGTAGERRRLPRHGRRNGGRPQGLSALTPDAVADLVRELGTTRYGSTTPTAGKCGR